MVGKFKRRGVQGCSLHEGLESVGLRLLSGIQVEINWFLKFLKLGHEMLLLRITAGNRICAVVPSTGPGHAEIRRASVYTTGRGSIALAFGPAVAEPVALHVQAKRCLVGMQRGYRDSLSADSIRSLALQGGPMAPMEVDAFLLLPRAKDALRLRAWDDRAKDNALRPATADQAIEGLRLLMQEVQAAT
jgi:hypothetical protein